MFVSKIADERLSETFRIKKSLEKDIVLLIKQRDQLLQEIAEQREGKNNTVKEKTKLSHEVESLEILIDSLRDLSIRERDAFNALSVKQRSQIVQINKDLTEKIKSWEEYKEKENTIIDIDSINKSHKEKIQELNSELESKKKDILALKQYEDCIHKSLDREKSKLELRERTLLKREETINKREKTIDAREKRRKEITESRKQFINLKKK